MNRLFTYTIPIDDGAAPNPFNGLCTLAICKPAIRRVAKVGDWIAGFGSKNAPSGDLRGKLVYAMNVKEVLSMKDYDLNAKSRWPSRIPQTLSLNLQDRLGDCIYDFSSGLPKLRPSVHGPENIETDLSGENVLVAEEFYYFGRNAIQLSPELNELIHQTQGHKSDSNQELFAPFVKWIREQGYQSGVMHGWPDYVVKWSGNFADVSCKARAEAASSDCL